jgi:hypothetical protein
VVVNGAPSTGPSICLGATQDTEIASQSNTVLSGVAQGAASGLELIVTFVATLD